jgi:hypothetical protein
LTSSLTGVSIETASIENARLPLWRLVAAFLVLAAMVGVLLALAPVYFEEYELGQYIRSIVASPAAALASDESIRAQVLARARQIDLPIRANDVQISRPGNKLQVQVNVKVQMDFSLYQVDVHFHPGATAP